MRVHVTELVAPRAFYVAIDLELEAAMEQYVDSEGKSLPPGRVVFCHPDDEAIVRRVVSLAEEATDNDTDAADLIRRAEVRNKQP